MRLLFAAAALLLACVDSSSAHASGIGWQIRYFSPDNAWSRKQLMHRLAFCVAMVVLSRGRVDARRSRASCKPKRIWHSDDARQRGRA